MDGWHDGRPQAAFMIRILIADDCDVVRTGIREILKVERDWEVVAEAADGKEAILKALKLKPDIAIVEISLPVVDGIEVTAHIRRRLPATEVLIFTLLEHEELICDALAAGARAYLFKSDPRCHLTAAVACLAVHRPFFTDRVSDTLLQSILSRRRPKGVLTDRQRTVLQLIAEGYTNKEITTFLDIGVKTVETHRAAIMRKLNLSSLAALVRYAVRNKIVEL